MLEPIRVALVGCGGTGSELLDGLARLHFALLGTGHPCGLQVSVYDPDTVSPANIGRQRFGPSDVGQYKAIILVHRFNMFYGLDWQAYPEAFAPKRLESNRIDLLVSCVDTATARVAIGKAGRRNVCDLDVLWLDCGNDAHTGQIVLGHLCKDIADEAALRLPNVYDLYPELDSARDDNAPSCSLREALARQDLLINRTVADAALSILWKLLREGRLTHHGAFVDVKRQTMQPLPVDPQAWAFLGYRSEATGDVVPEEAA